MQIQRVNKQQSFGMKFVSADKLPSNLPQKALDIINDTRVRASISKMIPLNGEIMPRISSGGMDHLDLTLIGINKPITRTVTSTLYGANWEDPLENLQSHLKIQAVKTAENLSNQYQYDVAPAEIKATRNCFGEIKPEIKVEPRNLEPINLIPGEKVTDNKIANLIDTVANRLRGMFWI